MPRTLVLLLALILLTIGGRAEAQEASSLTVDPPTLTVAPGADPFTVTITVDDITTEQGLGGYILTIDYDPAVVHALTVTNSGFLEETGSPVVCPASKIDKDAGRLAHFCLAIPILGELGPTTNEPQVLAVVTFEPVGEGTTTLDIAETSILDPEGNTLAATTTNGEVVVGAGDPAQPTQPAPESTAEAGDAAPASDGGRNVGLYVGLGLAGVAIVGVAGGVLMLRGRRRTT